MRMPSELVNRNVVVTGSNGGLGPSVVEALLAEGAICHLPLRAGSAPAARDRVQATPGIDLTDEAAVTAYYRGLPPLWASVHVAGGWAGAPITETPLALLRGQLDINLVTAFLCCREAVRAMRAQPGQGGRIVNVSSRTALVPAAGSLAYAAAKAGLNALTQGLAVEVKRDGILVNAVAPATIDTAKNRAAMGDAGAAAWAKPGDIAATIAWLVSPRNQLVTGAVIPV
jgi:NAD(P)-dependent dehydrogenase (short-subunit alcohol dehydrogenase family)